MWSNLKKTVGFSTPSPAPTSFKVGARVRLGPNLGDFTGYVVEAPSSPEDKGLYKVELYAPEEGEEGALNPFLVLKRLTDVRAAEMRPCAASEGAGLSAVGRPGASMCSVPVAELDQRGLGPNAAGRYARIGGLASRPDLNGLTCTILGGPTEQGRYSVELTMEEEGNQILLLRPECLTIRLRRGALQELVVPVTGGKRPAAAAPAVRNQVAAAEPPAPRESEELEDSSEEEEQQEQEAKARLDAPRGQRSSGAAPDPVASSNVRTSARNKASPAAAAALEAAARAARERKFDELDAYLARCCADEKDAPGLANAIKGPTACLPKSQVRGLPSPDPALDDTPVATLAKGEGAGQKVAKQALKNKKPKRRHSAPPSRGTPAQTTAKSLMSEDEQAHSESVDEPTASRERPRKRAGSASAARPPRMPESRESVNS